MSFEDRAVLQNFSQTPNELFRNYEDKDYDFHLYFFHDISMHLHISFFYMAFLSLFTCLLFLRIFP